MKVFISYRRDDIEDAAGRLYEHLKKAFGEKSLFKDVDSIPVGEDFMEIIEKSISSSDFILALIGKKWLTATDNEGNRKILNENDFVRLELETGITKGIRIIPVFVSGASVPSPEQLPECLRRIPFQNGAKLRADPDFFYDTQRIIRALKRADNSIRLKIAALATLLIVAALITGLYFYVIRPSEKTKPIKPLVQSYSPSSKIQTKIPQTTPTRKEPIQFKDPYLDSGIAEKRLLNTASGVASKGGIGVSDISWPSYKFVFEKQVTIERIGGTFNNYSSRPINVFAAIAEFSEEDKYPGYIELNKNNLVNYSYFSVPTGLSDSTTKFDVSLPKGQYLVVFGTGAFGAGSLKPNILVMPSLSNDADKTANPVLLLTKNHPNNPRGYMDLALTPNFIILKSKPMFRISFDDYEFEGKSRKTFSAIKSGQYYISVKNKGQPLSDALVIDGNSSDWYKGSASLMLALASKTVFASITRLDEEPFQVKALKASAVSDTSVPMNVEFFGLNSKGGTVTHSAFLMTSKGFQEIEFPSEFGNLVEFSWRVQSNGGFVVDDIQILDDFGLTIP